MKSPALDRDRLIELKEAVGRQFAQQMNELLNSEKVQPFMNAPRRKKIAQVISELHDFPFQAEMTGEAVCVTYSHQEGTKLKALSDGVTKMHQAIVRALREDDNMPEKEQSFMMVFSTLFHSALQEAYVHSGMKEGPHTQYIHRGC